jgi:hypothetical protein
MSHVDHLKQKLKPLTRRQKSQCAIWALDRIRNVGGYLVICKSTHWFFPHILHFTYQDGLTHFVPFTDLKQPWYSLFGFEGAVLYTDESDRAPLGTIGIILGSSVLVGISLIWAVRRQFSKPTVLGNQDIFTKP